MISGRVSLGKVLEKSLRPIRSRSILNILFLLLASLCILSLVFPVFPLDSPKQPLSPQTESDVNLGAILETPAEHLFTADALVANPDIFETAYRTYAAFLNETLTSRDFKDKEFVIVNINNRAGIGNRMPLMVSGFLWAMLTNRVFLTTYDHYYEYFSPPGLVNIEYAMYREDIVNQVLEEAEHPWWECNHSLFDSLLLDDLAVAWKSKKIIRFSCLDYPMLPLYANVLYKEKLLEMFPGYSAFYRLSSKLFRLNDKWQSLTAAYYEEKLASFDKIIGIHVRTKKSVFGRKPVSTEAFSSLARSIKITSGLENVAAFVATDSPETKSDLVSKLKEGGISAIQQEGNFLALNTVGGNPGTEDSAVFDLFTLSLCSENINTYSSSFGNMAAALSNKPYFMVVHESQNDVEWDEPWFIKSLSSEPCSYQARRYLEKISEEKRKLIQAVPLWMEQTQCHFYV